MRERRSDHELGARGEEPPAASPREGALPPPRSVQTALLVLQVVDIPLPLRIGHSFVTTLLIVRHPIVVLLALAIRHRSISALCVPAEPSEFEVYRRLNAGGSGVARVEATIAIVEAD